MYTPGYVTTTFSKPDRYFVVTAYPYACTDEGEVRSDISRRAFFVVSVDGVSNLFSERRYCFRIDHRADYGRGGIVAL